MSNQLATTEETTRRPLWSVVVILLAIALAGLLIGLGFYRPQQVNPYIRDVLSLQGNREQGQAIFLMNCAGCHGESADGRVGPSLHDVSNRRSKVSIIQQVISGETPPMPQFQPSTQEMADLLSYLETL